MSVGPADVRRAAELCAATLRPLVGRDWEQPAGELDWSARQTLEHIVEALGFYARDLATPVLAFPEHEVSLVCDPGCEPVGVIDGMVQMAAVVGAVVTATPPEVRGLHPFGLADRAGFAAMACDELLVHTADIASGLGAAFTPPADLCTRVLERLFPWAPDDGEPWQRLLWANGRTALPRRRRLARWRWHAAPLDEYPRLRAERPEDQAAVRAVHLSAFDTAEEADLVDALRASGDSAQSLVAVDGDEVVGHVMLSRVTLDGDDGGPAVALAPVAVRSERQGRGLGRALVWAAVDAADRAGESLVVLLGHASYYPQFGFESAGPLGITCPMDAPEDAWMALPFDPGHPHGLVRYPPPFGI